MYTEFRIRYDTMYRMLDGLSEALSSSQHYMLRFPGLKYQLENLRLTLGSNIRKKKAEKEMIQLRKGFCIQQLYPQSQTT